MQLPIGLNRRRAFLKDVQDGSVLDLVGKWEPWWYSPNSHKVSFTPVNCVL